jgi:hypothetical protein
MPRTITDAQDVLAIELYDHADDPHEPQNIAGATGKSQIVRDLKDKLAERLE